MKRHMAWIFAVLMLVAMLTGCSSAPAAEQTEEVKQESQETVRVAFSLDQMTEGNAVWVEGMRSWIEENNASSDQQVELTVFDANASVEKQLSDVDTIIVDGYDVLIFSCVDSVGSIPAMEAADKAGMTVIDIRDTGCAAADVGATFQDEKVMTDKLRNWMQTQLDADPDFEWNVGIIYGAAAQTLQLERGDFIKRWAEEDDRINIVADAYGDWDTAVAMSITEDWLQVHDNINIIVAANIGMAQGVSAALQTANVKEDVKVITFDITDDTILNVRDGVIDASVGMNFIDVGRGFMDLAMQVYNGEYTDSKYVCTDLYIVESSNYEEYLPS